MQLAGLPDKNESWLQWLWDKGDTRALGGRPRPQLPGRVC